MISFNGVKSLLTIIATECVYVLLVDDGGTESALADIHWSEVLPLVLLNVEELTVVQEDVLDSVVAAHNIHVGAVDDGRMLFSHLVHVCSEDDLALCV